MKIKYLKDAPLGKTGDIADVTDIEGNVLVHLGFAAVVHADESIEFQSVALISPPVLLLNLNGTPVVSDFGDLVPENSIINPEKQPEQPAPKARNRDKSAKKGE